MNYNCNKVHFIVQLVNIAMRADFGLAELGLATAIKTISGRTTVKAGRSVKVSHLLLIRQIMFVRIK